jgi:hypothetical protein
MTETWRYDEVETPTGFPWPPAEGDSALGSLGVTWKSATFEPTRFFGALPRDSGTGAAIVYYLIIGLLVAGASLFWDMAGDVLGTGRDVVIADGPEISPVVGFLLSPLLLLIGLVLSAGLTHMILILVRGATGGFDTTLRVFAYAYSPMLFGVVPVVGAVAGAIWMLGVAMLGLAAAHAADRWKAVVAVGLPFLLLLGVVAMVLLAMAAAGTAVLG